ncbi:MAG TPA: hypothetical protein VM870_10185 [Pyrinomonadaceae bacterium]|jgi:hypothetical protein|nr:hypothetical protein [Pyrinomonadaceae bacterium]
MKGTIVHFRGKFRRSLERHGRKPRVKVEITLPETLAPREAEDDQTSPRPAHYAFFVNGELFAYSRKVTFAQGRRYSQVEHWFVCADDVR